MTQSFFVGDSAGRVRDHSADDLNFAANVGLPFYTQVSVGAASC
jgi:histidinol phosphatase-like enzyme